MSNKKILVGMILINLLSMILGFVRDSSIAISLGATSISDVFMFTINLPTVLFSALGWVIMSTFVPTYTDVMINQSDKKLNEFANIFLKLTICFTIIIVLILLAFNKFSIAILAPGFKGESFLLTKRLFVIIIPSLVFLNIASCIAAILNAHKKMIWVSMLGIPINIMTILAVVFVYPKYGIEMSTVTVLLGSIIQILILLYPLTKTKFRITSDFNLKDKNIKNIIAIIGPMIIGVMAQQINSMFGGAITSTLVEGSLTSYNLATKIVNAAYSSIILIGISYIFPYLSHDFASGMIEKFKSTVSKSINLIFLILMPITILIINLNEEIISILYGYGRFTKQAILITSQILIFSSISIVFMGIRELINRAYYSSKNTKTPMRYSILGIVLNIILALFLSPKFDVLGVAIAGSISTLISTIGIYIKFKKDFKIIAIVKKDMFKYSSITILLFYTAKFIQYFTSMTFGVFITTIITTIITLGIYLFLIFILRINIKEYINWL